MATGEIEDIRLKIDEVDWEIIRLLEARMKLCRLIKEAKKKADLPLRDPQRERVVLERAGVYQPVFQAIIELCRRVQGE